jgi:hypothetical protein
MGHTAGYNRYRKDYALRLRIKLWTLLPTAAHGQPWNAPCQALRMRSKISNSCTLNQSHLRPCPVQVSFSNLYRDVSRQRVSGSTEKNHDTETMLVTRDRDASESLSVHLNIPQIKATTLHPPEGTRESSPPRRTGASAGSCSDGFQHEMSSNVCIASSRT